MKILTIFKSTNLKDKILSNIESDNMQETSNSIIIPNKLKLEYNTSLKCFCYDLLTTEKIIASTIEVDKNKLIFNKDLDSVLIECNVFDFNRIQNLSLDKQVSYFNKQNQELKFYIKDDYLNVEVNVKQNRCFLKLTFDNIDIEKNIQLYEQRIYSRPLIYLDELRDYLDLGDLEFKPELQYIYYEKILKSDVGFKKYSKFMDQSKLKFKLINKTYEAKLKSGFLKFTILNLTDKYPNKIHFRTTDKEDLKYIEELKNFFNINQISLIAKIKNLDLNLDKLKEKDFYKDDEFFIFYHQRDKFKVTYDIFNKTAEIRQDFNNYIDVDYIKNYIKELIQIV